MASDNPQSERSNLRLVEISTGAVRWDVRVESRPMSIKVAPNGRLMGFISIHSSGRSENGQQRDISVWEMRIRFWDAVVGTVQREFICFQVEKHGDPLLYERGYFTAAFSFSSDSKLAAVGWGEKLRVWDFTTGTLLRDLQHQNMTIKAVNFFGKRELVAYGVSDCGFLESWDIETDTTNSLKLDEFLAGDWRHGYLRFSPDCKLLAISFEHDGARMWDTTTGELKRIVDSQYGYGYPQISADNKLLALVYRPKIKVWDILTGAIAMTFKEFGVRPQGPPSQWKATGT